MTKLRRVRKISVEIEAGRIYINSSGRGGNSSRAGTSHFPRGAHIAEPSLNTFPFTSFVKNFLGSHSGKLTGLSRTDADSTTVIGFSSHFLAHASLIIVFLHFCLTHLKSFLSELNFFLLIDMYGASAS